MCRSKKVSQISQFVDPDIHADSSSEESIFHVSQTHSSKIQKVKARTFNIDTVFLVDSGPTVNADTCNTVCPNVPLKTPCPTIQIPCINYGADQPLPVLGYFTINIAYKQQITRAKFFVVDS